MEKVEHKSFPVTAKQTSRYVIAFREKVSRKKQILQTLIMMLESCPGERITTARLATEVGVSEAALYRHFPSKAKMFEGLIASIEETLSAGVTAIIDKEADARVACECILTLLIEFSEKNPGLSRLLTGDILNGETERLRLRIIRLFNQLEIWLLQVLLCAEQEKMLRTELPNKVIANMLLAVAEGRIIQFVRSRFQLKPSQHWSEQLAEVMNIVFR